MKNKNIIIFSSIDWTTHWQIHHQLTTSLIKSGNSVLFIENIGVRSPSFKDLNRVKSRIKSRINSTHGFSKEEKRLTVNSPIFIPFPYNKFAVYFNSLIISKAIKNWSKKAHFDNFIVISFLPTPTVQKIIQIISPTVSLYYCADDMARTLRNPAKLDFFEKKMFESSDYIFTTSSNKYKQAKIVNSNVANIPAGVSVENFSYSPDDDSLPQIFHSLNTPIIGYIGAISDVLDKKLIIEIANSFSKATILLVGPVHTDLSKFQAFSNIVVTGEVPHTKLSKYVQNFNVGLIPYLVNNFTNSVYPCKLNEYLAMGIPVVSSNLEEIKTFEKKYNGSVAIAKDTDEFVNKIDMSLNDENALSKIESLKRVEIAKKNTWDSRFEEIKVLIEESIEDKFSKKVDWRLHLKNYYKEKRLIRFKRITALLIFYLILFQSPLAWYFGDKLVLRETPRESQAIVVFSGNGESSYRNTSFQRRALDAVKFFNEGYANKIYLSSGIDQTISEVEFIKLFLLSKGIPEDSIYILEDYPNSTYKNVLMVSESLDKNSVNSILFITSPYHSLRALMTWNKNAPHIQIVTPAVVDTPSSKAQWGIGLTKMKIIVYEYMAIIHNWFKGRI